MFREVTAHSRDRPKKHIAKKCWPCFTGLPVCEGKAGMCVGRYHHEYSSNHPSPPPLPTTTCHSPENIFLRFSTAAANWLCCTTASFTSLRLSMVLMLCLQSLLTSARDCWISLTSFSALWSWLRPVRTPSSCDWIAA